jgi:hypothetical protein
MAKYIVAVLLIGVLVGCSAMFLMGPIMEIGIMWVNGEAHKYYYNDKSVTEKAVRAVLKDMEFVIEKDYNKGKITYINADNAKDKKEGKDRRKDVFKIKIDPVRHNVTELSIRVDTMGDHPYAELIYREVDKHKGMRCFNSVDQLQAAFEEN